MGRPSQNLKLVFPGSHSNCTENEEGQLTVTSSLNRQVQEEGFVNYRQLSEVDRYQIEAGIAFGMTITEISRRIKRHRSTVFRELRRNGHLTREGYSALSASQDFRKRRKVCRPEFKIKGTLKTWIDEKLRAQWSPEQIVGRAQLEGRDMVGIETIYRYVYRDKLRGGALWKNLRHRRPKRKNRFREQRWPERIPRPSIDERPQVINQRERVGDFERDLIVGKERKGYLLTIVDRKTNFVKIVKIAAPKAKLVHDATIGCLQKITVKSLTNDNGCEFMDYHKTKAALGDIPIYFTRPYASWERGSVENMNKLIRQYFPKHQRLDRTHYGKIKMVEALLNQRPRKKLAYRTPIEANNN